MNIKMNDIKDKAFRHQLIERYLDADTSIEEEKALASFYRHAEENMLTEEDINIRNITLGMKIAANEAFAYDETEGKHAITEEECTQEVAKARKSNLWIRFSAIILAAAMLAGLIFLAFPIKHQEKQNFAALTPASTTIRSLQTSSDDMEAMNPLAQMERADSAFLADTKDIVSPKEASKLAKASLQAQKDNSRSINKIEKTVSTNASLYASTNASAKQTALKVKTVTKNEPETENHYYDAYEVASLALPSADQLKIDKQGNHLVITAIDDAGNAQHYTVNIDDAQDGAYQLHPLAQLEESSTH